MEIAVLVGNIGDNLGRTLPIAKLLARNHPVNVIGCSKEGSFETPYEHQNIDFTVCDVYNGEVAVPRFFRSAHNILAAICGNDLIYSIGPQYNTFGTALRYTERYEDLPVLLDISDWMAASFYEYSLHQKLYHAIRYWRHINNGLYNRLMERHTDKADAITVASTFLQDLFGGTLLPRITDCDLFNPNRYDKGEVRKKYGVTTETVLVHAGTITRFKGLPEVADAIKPLDNVEFLIAGPDNPELRAELQARSGGKINYVGKIPYTDVPELLAAGDIAPILQEPSLSNEAKMPQRVGEAMAMENAILATPVSDLPQLIETCGITVPPNDINAIRTAVKSIAENEELRNRLIRNSRETAVNNLGFSATIPKIERVLSSL